MEFSAELLSVRSGHRHFLEKIYWTKLKRVHHRNSNYPTQLGDKAIDQNKFDDRKGHKHLNRIVAGVSWTCMHFAYLFMIFLTVVSFSKLDYFTSNFNFTVKTLLNVKNRLSNNCTILTLLIISNHKTHSKISYSVQRGHRSTICNLLTNRCVIAYLRYCLQTTSNRKISICESVYLVSTHCWK